MKPLCIVSCPIDTFSGYGARSRDFVKYLLKLKNNEWDIFIMPQKWGDTPQNFLAPDDDLRSLFRTSQQFNGRQPDIWVQITIPSEFQPIGRYNIGVTAGIESTAYPGDFIEGFNRMNMNLVSSEHSRKVALTTKYEKIDKSTNKVVSVTQLEKPLEVLFEGLDLNTFFKKPTKTNILKDIPEEFCFLYTGHWLSGKLGEDRKNTGLMIKTFLETFNTPSNKKPALILKTNHIDFSISDREQILKNISNIRKSISGNLPNIYLLHGELTNSEMNELNNDPKVKVFLNFTKGEGFGRPLLEGAITGKPTITTNWSGHIDFLKPNYNILVGGELKSIHPSAANKWLIKESQWFNIDVEVANKAMKDIYKHYKDYFAKSRKQTQYIKDNWSIDKMTEKLNTLLPKIEAAPQTQSLKLPKLKKVNTEQTLPKLKLPKLKKITV